MGIPKNREKLRVEFKCIWLGIKSDTYEHGNERWMCEIWGFYSGVVAGEVLGSISLLNPWKLRRQASSKRREPLTSENTRILKLEFRTGWDFWLCEGHQLLKEVHVVWSHCPLSDGSGECSVADFIEHRAESEFQWKMFYLLRSWETASVKKDYILLNYE
jgi:hypothetical protein